MARLGSLFLMLAILLDPVEGAAQEITWDKLAYDPAVEAADLTLPLPCGGALAFVRVDTKARADNPRDDAAVRLGAPNQARAPEEGLRAANIRGSFDDEESNTTYFYIGRYEVTRDQWAAVMAASEGASCPEPDDFDGALPKTDVSWFEAVDFTRRLTEWARSTIAEQIPHAYGAPGFFRLPSEVEWEFAARGGLAVNETQFNTQWFPMEGNLSDYAWHQGLQSSGGEIQLIGGRRPNPLGLYDIYGNASEMVVDLFKLNNLGREHGQVGGFIARGGSFNSQPAGISSATREEYPFYGRGEAIAFSIADVGFRLVLASHIFVSGAVETQIRDEWKRSIEPRNVDDPLSLIDDLIANEVDERRIADLDVLRAFIVADRRARDEALATALRQTLFSGVTLMRRLREGHARFDRVRISVSDREAQVAAIREERAALPAGSEYDGTRETRDASIRRLELRLETMKQDIARREISLKTDLRNYGDTILAIYESASLEAVEREAEDLELKLLRSGQENLAPYVPMFVGALDAYWENPAMSEAEMLERIPEIEP